MSPKKQVKPAKSNVSAGNVSNVWTDEEKAAMREIAKERKAEARANKNREEGEKVVRAAIAALPEPDRSLAKQFHSIVEKSAPVLSPKTWYGMPAYADKDGEVVCFFQSAAKFKTRYATIGFSDKAKLDEGAMWPVAFALMELTTAEEARIGALVKRAAG